MSLRFHMELCFNGLLARYMKLRVAHAPGMPGTFSPPPWVSDPDMHHGTCVTHVPWCMPGSLTDGFLWSRWRGKRFRHSRRMRKPQFAVSGKRPMVHKHYPMTIESGEYIWVKSAAGGCIQNLCGHIQNDMHYPSDCVKWLRNQI